MDDDHHDSEDVHANGDEALLALGAVILDSKCQGIVEPPSPSDRETPCFLTFAASFFGSKSADTKSVYVRYTYPSIRHSAPELGSNVELCGAPQRAGRLGKATRGASAPTPG